MSASIMSRAENVFRVLATERQFDQGFSELSRRATCLALGP
jgi:hypothetical protein